MNFNVKFDKVVLTVTRPFSCRPDPAFSFTADNYQVSMDIEQMVEGIKALVEKLLPKEMGETLGKAMSDAMREAASEPPVDPLFHGTDTKQKVCYICDDFRDGDIDLNTAVRLHNEVKKDLPQ